MKIISIISIKICSSIIIINNIYLYICEEINITYTQ